MTVVVVMSGTEAADPEWVAFARVLTAGLPIGVGLYAYYLRPEERFGPLLVAAGFGWWLTTFSESDDDLLYSVGRVAGFVMTAALIYVILAFPSGRLPGSVDRAIVAAAAAILCILALPTALLVENYAVPVPWTTCDSSCPGNAFMVPDHEPGFVESVVHPLRDSLVLLLYLAAALRVGQRIRHATRLMRRTLSPVLMVAVAYLISLVLGVVGRWADPSSPVERVLLWVIALSVPAMALGFLVGLLRWRLFVAGAVHRLALGLGAHPGPKGLRAALVDAFDDPMVRLAYPAPDSYTGWVNADGLQLKLPAAGDQQSVTEVRDRDRVVAAIIHDAALDDQRELIDTAAAYAAMTLQNQALGARVNSSLRELRESRARVLASADEERRRIERDLHDGAQQRLVALRIKLELAEEVVKQDPERGLVRLHALGAEVTEALDEIRSLARGVYPSLLADRGLAEALRAAGMRAPIATTVAPDGIGRYHEDIEAAVYFSVLEALQNASKHAHGAERVTISLNAGKHLRFEVRDDGAGFDPGAEEGGAGLANIRDRLAAVGGALEISSEPGRGTVVSGSVPLD